MLWAGASDGFLASFYTQALRPYASSRVHSSLPVLQIAAADKALLALTPESLRLATRRGTTKTTLDAPAALAGSLACMAPARDAELYLGSTGSLSGIGTNEILKLNLDAPAGSVFSTASSIPLSPGSAGAVKIVRTAHALVAGKSNGAVDIIDPNTNRVVKSFQAHTSVVSDLDARETTLLTCGYSLRKAGAAGQLLLDPLVNIFDLRAGKPLPPVPFPAGAGFVRLHPKLSTCAFIASQTGQIQLIDFANPASTQVRLHQAALASSGTLSGLEVSSSGDFLALTDGAYVQLWSNSADDPTFNEFAAPLDFPVDPAVYTQPISSMIPAQPRRIDIDDDSTPLSAIGLPYYKDELLSSWSIEPGMPMVFDEGMPPAKLPPDVLRQLQAAINDNSSTDIHPTDLALGGIGLTGISAQDHARRNVAQKYVSFKDLKRRTIASGPKFISERSGGAGGTASAGAAAGTGGPGGSAGSGNSADETTPPASSSDMADDTSPVPRAYRRLEIKYSKFGIADFDFGYYNHTQYSGLEPQFVNSYCNPLLQLYCYSRPIYEFALNQLKHNSLDDKSLLAELGLLFDMLHKAKGLHCAAANFVKALSTIPQANALGLVTDDAHPLRVGSRSLSVSSTQPQPGSPLAAICSRTLGLATGYAPGHGQGLLLQAFARFLMERMAIDERAYDASAREFEKIAGIVVETSTHSPACQSRSVLETVVYSLELVQPKSAFLPTLQASLDKRSRSSKAWCDTCRKFHTQTATRTVRARLPKVLNLHVPLADETVPPSNWPEPQFAVRTEQAENQPTSLKIVADAQPGDDIYELLGLVVEIQTNAQTDSAPASASSAAPGSRPSRNPVDTHLITFVKIEGQWHLFNDFLVKPVSEAEALEVTSWKTPVVLLYQRKEEEAPPFDYNAWINSLDTSILYRDHFAAGFRAGFKREYELLDPTTEAPEPGTLVAMDTEFVLLQHEETEIISDGTKSLVRPKEVTLARVSVVRGTGPKQGVPFIDDFIATSETIVDYLTEYSGVEQGDLDPWTSTRGSLVTQQTSYKRLWLLLNLGCVFVGHGLDNDFRTIGIHVPSAQVVDTLGLFYLPEYKRRLSLKFLAYALLHENVQTGNHDSIEDAVTALRLYKEYMRVSSKGPDAFVALLHQLYKEGKKCNFRPPPKDV